MTNEEAIGMAEKYNLQEEIALMIEDGCSPEEALDEWDII